MIDFNKDQMNQNIGNMGRQGINGNGSLNISGYSLDKNQGKSYEYSDPLFDDGNSIKPGAVIAYSGGGVHLITTGNYSELQNNLKIYQDIAPYGSLVKVVDTSGIVDMEDIIKDPKRITQAFERWFLNP